MTSTEPRIPEPSTTGTVDFRGHQTWYRVTGDLDPERRRRRWSCSTAVRAPRTTTA